MKIAVLILFATSIALSCGCSSFGAGSQANTAVNDFSDKDLPEVIVSGRKIGDTLLEALQKNDYSLAEKLPLGDDKQKFSKEKFDRLYKNIQKQGGIAKFSYLGDMNMKPYHRLLWKISFTDQPGKAGNGVDVMFELIMVKFNGVNRAAGFALRP